MSSCVQCHNRESLPPFGICWSCLQSNLMLVAQQYNMAAKNAVQAAADTKQVLQMILEYGGRDDGREE
jgi:hypothetical protein